MTRPLTLDASVFVSASNPAEAACAACRALMAAVHEREIPLIEPTLMPVEVAAAVRRALGDAMLARQFEQAVLGLPQLTLVALEDGLMRQAAQMAMDHALRGADAVYVATALRYGTVLVTLDAEQRARAPKSVRACTPAEAIRLIAT